MFAFKCVRCGKICYSFVYDDSGPCIYCGNEEPQLDVTTEVYSRPKKSTEEQGSADRPQ